MDRWMMRMMIGVAAVLALSIALTVGVGFVCFALYQWLHELMSAPAAAAATGGAVFAVAALALLATALIASLCRKRQAKRSPSESMLAMELAGLLGKDAAAFIAARPLETLLVSLASGFALGAFPGLRHALGDLLRKR